VIEIIIPDKAVDGMEQQGETESGTSREMRRILEAGGDAIGGGKYSLLQPDNNFITVEVGGDVTYTYTGDRDAAAFESSSYGAATTNFVQRPN
jgi:hypothetical protein